MRQMIATKPPVGHPQIVVEQGISPPNTLNSGLGITIIICLDEVRFSCHNWQFVKTPSVLFDAQNFPWKLFAIILKMVVSFR